MKRRMRSTVAEKWKNGTDAVQFADAEHRADLRAVPYADARAVMYAETRAELDREFGRNCPINIRLWLLQLTTN
jgi:hypothetical protein